MRFFVYGGFLEMEKLFWNFNEKTDKCYLQSRNGKLKFSNSENLKQTHVITQYVLIFNLVLTSITFSRILYKYLH